MKVRGYLSFFFLRGALEESTGLRWEIEATSNFRQISGRLRCLHVCALEHPVKLSEESASRKRAHYRQELDGSPEEQSQICFCFLSGHLQPQDNRVRP